MVVKGCVLRLGLVRGQSGSDGMVGGPCATELVTCSPLPLVSPLSSALLSLLQVNLCKVHP